MVTILQAYFRNVFFNENLFSFVNNTEVEFRGQKVSAKCKGQRSKFNATEVIKTLSSKFEHVQKITPVYIQRWLWNGAQSFMGYRRGVLLLFNVIPRMPRSHGAKTSTIWPCFQSFQIRAPVSINRLLWNDTRSFQGHRRVSIKAITKSFNRKWREKGRRDLKHWHVKSHFIFFLGQLWQNL